MIKIVFGDDRRPVLRKFDVAPRAGDIVHITHEERLYDLFVDMVQHVQEPDDETMRCLVHGHIIDDLPVFMERLLDRAHN